jgi:hypothetical protein
LSTPNPIFAEAIRDLVASADQLENPQETQSEVGVWPSPPPPPSRPCDASRMLRSEAAQLEALSERVTK